MHNGAIETKFNFNSAICTSRSQSEKLLALGLKKETADICLIRRSKMANWEISPFPYQEWAEQINEGLGYTLDDIFPAWSLHRLLTMTTSKRKVMLIRCESDIYDVVIKKIEREIKEGCFNKEYLL